MLERLPATALETWARARDAAARVLTPAVRLGVTGLSRSGKTVFITSLVHNILAGNALPFFEPLAQGRIVRAYLEPQPDDAVPRFDYEGNLEKLTAGEPRWPESTRQISELRLTIEYEPAGQVWRALGSGTMHLDIVDYPGEWLLDLPLLDLSYEDWSRQAISLAREAARAPAAKDWLGFLALGGRFRPPGRANRAERRGGFHSISAQVPGGSALAFEPAAGALPDAGRPRGLAGLHLLPARDAGRRASTRRKPVGDDGAALPLL